MVWIGLHGVMFLFLFSDFYKQNYSEKQKRLKAEAKLQTSNGKVHFNDENNSTQMVSLVRLFFFCLLSTRHDLYDLLANSPMIRAFTFDT